MSRGRLRPNKSPPAIQTTCLPDIMHPRENVSCEFSLPSSPSRSKVIFLSGGPVRRSDGVEVACHSHGAEAVIIEWVNDPTGDRLGDSFYASLWHRLHVLNEFGAALIATPCDTFSSARSVEPGETQGPRASRGAVKPDLYGLKHLSVSEKRRAEKKHCSQPV